MNTHKSDNTNTHLDGGSSEPPPQPNGQARAGDDESRRRRQAINRQLLKCRKRTSADIFKQAKADLTIPDLWPELGLSGYCGPTCNSPFRTDRNPSFSIYKGGHRWKDHSTGEGGDVMDFILKARDKDMSDVREWLMERYDGKTWTFPLGEKWECQPWFRTASPMPIKVPKFKLRTCTEDELRQVALSRGLSEAGVIAAADAGILRFSSWQDRPCYVITDNTRRATEARALDGRGFGFEGCHKAAPLAGVDKSWLPGATHLRDAVPDTSVLLVEGATDLLAAYDLYHDYRENLGGQNNWVPVALLGAGCKRLDPECGELIGGRHVRIVPDGDIAGDQMVQHWAPQLQKLGCAVDIVEMPRGKDLSDMRPEINPTEIFS